jgi:hypothetical protein
MAALDVGSPKMSATESKPKWKRGLSVTVKIYAGFCTLLVTAYFALLLWDNYFNQRDRLFRVGEIRFMADYGMYMAQEHPKRGDLFASMAMTLGMYAKETNVHTAELFSYMGKPDLIDGNTNTGTLAYIYDLSNRTDKWAVIASVKKGKVTQVGINALAAVSDRLQPYSAPLPPNNLTPPNRSQR